MQGMPEYIPYVVQAVPYKDRKIVVFFDDGAVRLYDTSHLHGGVFEKLNDEQFFRSRLTVINDTASWDVTGDRDPTESLDIDPITIYMNGIPVPDVPTI